MSTALCLGGPSLWPTAQPIAAAMINPASSITTTLTGFCHHASTTTPSAVSATP